MTLVLGGMLLRLCGHHVAEQLLNLNLLGVIAPSTNKDLH